MIRIISFYLVVIVTLPYGVHGNQSETNNDLFEALKNIPVGPFTLDLGGSLRLRYEYQENFNQKQYGLRKNDGFLLERFRFQGDLRYRERVRFFLQFQDAHVFDYKLHDREFVSNPNEDEAELHQGFLELTPSTRLPLTLKLGRQVIAYGDDRIFGPGDWGNTGRMVWDAAKARFSGERLSLDAFYGRTVIHDDHSFNLGHDHERQAYALYTSFLVIPEHTFDVFYYLALDEDGDTQGEVGRPDDQSVHTVGVRVAGEYNNFDYDGTFARQLGSWGPDEMRAWALHAGAGFTFPTFWSPRVGIEYVHASGDDDPFDGKHKTFDPAFGSRDRYYGWMNLFSWRNIENWQFSLSFTPLSRLKCVFDYHLFRLAQEKDAWYSTGPVYRRDEEGKSGRDMGKEIDVTIYCSVTNNIDLRAGYAHFFPGDFVRKTGPHGGADWIHFQWFFHF